MRVAVLGDVIGQVPLGAGRLAGRMRWWHGAAAAYGSAVRFAPRRADWRVEHARVLARCEEWDEAARELERATRLDPGRGEAWWRLGNARTHLGFGLAAAQAYETAVRCDPANVRWQKSRARAYRSALAFTEAADAYADLAELEPDVERWATLRRRMLDVAASPTRSADAHLARFAELTAARSWEDAAREAGIAVAIDPGRAEAHYRLGDAYWRLQRNRSARRSYQAGLRVDPTRRAIDDAMLKGRVRDFHARRRIAALVEDDLAEIQARVAERERRAAPTGPRRVFVYWAQGFDQAPPVVRMCHEQLLAVHGPDVVVTLDDSNLSEWVDLPADVVAVAHPHRAQYSDLVRTALLSRHGGVWVDATVLVVRPLPETLPALTPTGWFTYRYRNARVASWFMAADAESHVVATMLEAQLFYWRHFGKVISYFLFHDLFEVMHFLDERFAAVVDGSPNLRPSWAMHDLMRSPYDADLLVTTLRSKDVHKLSHKRKGADQEPGTMLAHLLAHGVPDLGRADVR